MRGNEIYFGHHPPKERVFEFLIPMRGNEPTAPRRERGREQEFLIPMRGNEVGQKGTLDSLKRISFLIPMRGNEYSDEDLD